MPNLVEIIVKTLDESAVGMSSAESRAKESGARAGRNFSEGMKPHIMGMGKMLLGAFAITGGIEIFKGIIERGEEAERITGLVSAAIKSTGGAAHVTTQEVDDLSRAISEKTGKDDEAIRAGQAMLLTFKRVQNVAGENNDIFNQASSILTDMTAALHGGDVTTEGMRKQAIQLGKALNDPIKGMTALRRVGVTFSAGQLEQVKNLENTGHHLEAQKFILHELQTEFGGAAAKSSTAVDRLKNSFLLLSDDIATTLAPAVKTGAEALDGLIAGLVRGQQVAQEQNQPNGIVGFLNKMGQDAHASAEKTFDIARAVDKWTVSITNHLPGGKALNDQLSRLRGESVKAKGGTDQLNSSIDVSRAKYADLIHPSDDANHSIFMTGKRADDAAPKVQTLTDKVNALKGAQFQLSAAVAWDQLLVQSKNDAVNLSKALDKSKNSVGQHTQKERDARSATETYISDLIQMAKQAGNNKEKQDLARQAIERVIPKLENVKNKSASYRDMLSKLKDMLHQLANTADPHLSIFMRGKGTWGIFGKNPVNSGLFNAPGGASGRFIDEGTTPTADDVLIRASKGELIVPTNMVNSGAVDHLRGKIPGFAGGGISGSYGGSAGSPFRDWIGHNWNASINVISNSMAHGMAQAFKNAMGAMMAFNVPNVGSGVQRWGPLVTRALRMEGLNPMLAARVMYQMQTESGGNPNIVNTWDSNAAAGTPSMGLMQVIGPTFRAYHWPGTSWNILNPLANIAAALNYARHRYGSTLMSGGMGIGSGHGYDSGGYLPTGLSLAYNGTGAPEPVGPTAGGSAEIHIHLHGDLATAIREIVQTQGGGDVQEAFGG